MDAFDAKLKKIMEAKGPKRMTASQSHWDGTYSAKGDNVSWYQPGQSRSLEIKSIAAPMRDVPIIDIGAGGSRLADDQLAAHDATSRGRALQADHEGRRIEVNMHVEDPVAYTTPWNAIQRYRHVNDEPMVEMVCAENNDSYFNYDVVPLPHEDRPDF